MSSNFTEEKIRKFACIVCGSFTDENQAFMVHDYQYLSGREYPYFECKDCGCLQLAEIPENLSQFYPETYYSYSPVGGRRNLYRRLKDALEKKRNRYEFYGKGLLGRLLCAPLPEPALRILAHTNPDPVKSRILDVGCGSGHVLNFLASEGFKHLTGVDPVLKQPINYENGVRILNQEFQNVTGEYDVIMFNYSMEHIPDNLAALKHARDLLAPCGVIIVDIPTTDSIAYKTYGVNWECLIAPDHVVLHSNRSFNLIADQARLEITNRVWTSQAAQFWLSENIRSGFSHKVKVSKWTALKNRIYRGLYFFPQHFAAMKLNRKGQGDLVAYFLKPKT